MSATSSDAPISRIGLMYAIAAYTAWGFFPLFWKQIGHLPSPVVLSYRIVVTALFFFALVGIRGKLKQGIRELASGRKALLLAVSSLLIGVNWFTFLAAILAGHITEASLGYFINPLMNSLIGMLVLKERLSRLQWVALALATAGVVVITIRFGQVPWIALLLASTFAVYGLIRKRVAIETAVGSTFESMLLSVPSLGFLALLWLHRFPELETPAPTISDYAFLGLGGIFTAMPLLWFAEAAKRLPLSTLGFCQYIAPTLQFLSAVLIFSEPFTDTHQMGFACIWAALIVFFLDTRVRAGARRKPA